MSADPNLLNDALDIIANDPSQENKLSTVIFLKTMIRNNFSKSLDMQKEQLQTSIKTMLQVLVESNISLKIKSHLGICIKVGLNKIKQKNTEEENIK